MVLTSDLDFITFLKRGQASSSSLFSCAHFSIKICNKVTLLTGKQQKQKETEGRDQMVCEVLIITSEIIRALASARGSVARRAQRHRKQPLEGPKAQEWPKNASPRARRARGRAKLTCPSRRLPVLLYVFPHSAQNRNFRG